MSQTNITHKYTHDTYNVAVRKKRVSQPKVPLGDTVDDSFKVNSDSCAAVAASVPQSLLEGAPPGDNRRLAVPACTRGRKACPHSVANIKTTKHAKYIII
jgi:hypothetical protein